MDRTTALINPGITFLFLLNLAYVGLLPRIFFKKGSFHWLWWITAVPFLLCSLVLIGSFFRFLMPMRPLESWITDLLSVPFGLASISLISFTLGTHRTRLALWHQKDAPESIVTYGAYRYVRHPFYTAFLLALFGALVFCPHAGTLFAFVSGFLILNFTAAREEKFLSESQFSREYREYLERTGRFLPRLLPGRTSNK